LCPRVDLFWWLCPGVFQYAALDAASPQVLIDRIGTGMGHLNRNAMLGSIGYLMVACHAPLAHRRNDFQVRGEGVERDIEAHLVVAFAGAAMCYSYSSFCSCYLNQEACDQWACQGGCTRILPLVDRP